MEHNPQKWRADFERDGYLIVEDCLDPVTLQKLRSAIEDLSGRLAESIQDITEPPACIPRNLAHWIEFERDFVQNNPDYNELSRDDVGTAIRNIMELPLFHPLFADLICYEPLLDILETLFASSEFAFHNYKCIMKAPRVSSKFFWHRDLPYLAHSSPNLLTAMLCLDDMTEENGATVLLPGTHKVAHETVTDADRNIPEDSLPSGPRVTACCPAGSAVLFHVNIIHGGGGNRTDAPRRNVIGIWSGPGAYPITAARYAYQDLMPRSKDPARIKQTRDTFPNLFAKG